MTTMRHRFNKDNKDNKKNEETPEERAARLERLLDASADWEPDTSSPEDLVTRAIARVERERDGSWWNRFRFAQPWWGASALGLTAAVSAIVVIACLNSGPEQAVLYIPRSSDAPHIWQADRSIIPGEEESTSYRTVALTEGSARPVMCMPTMTPAGYTTQLAIPEEYTAVTETEYSSESAEPAVSMRKSSFLTANSRSKRHKNRSPFRYQRNVPTVVKGTKGAEVDELDLPPVWQEETVTRQDYRVAVPVMLTPNDSGGSNPLGIPAVVELTFDPPTVPLRSTFDQ